MNTDQLAEPDELNVTNATEAEILCSAVLNKDNFVMLLAQCKEERLFEQSIFLGEMQPRHFIRAEERDALIRFMLFDATRSSETYMQYTSGRIFNADCELRWQHEQDQLHVTYIGSRLTLPFLQVSYDLQRNTWLEKRPEQQAYYLFGERLGHQQLENIGAPAVEGDFAEARIPRLLHYPLAGKKRYAQIVVQEYLDKRTGQVACYRFVAVKEAS